MNALTQDITRAPQATIHERVPLVETITATGHYRIEDSQLRKSLLDSVCPYIAKVPCGQGGCFSA
jgi:hypothetical protein